MAKLITWFCIGVFTGAGAMLFAMAGRESIGSGPEPPALTEPPAAPDPSAPASADRRDAGAADLGAAQVLADLRAVANPFALRRTAHEAVTALGGTEDAVARVAAVLPEADRLSFTIEAYAELARTSPRRALDLALALPDNEARRTAVERIAAAWGRDDPVAALGQAETLADLRLRAVFGPNVLAAWAKRDPVTALDYLLSDGGAPSVAQPGVAIATIAAQVPLALLEAVERFPADMQSSVRQEALRGLGGRDPLGAVAIARDMPGGPDREALIGAAAPGFARADPAAALEWARSLKPPSRWTAGQVLATIAQVDFDRALAIAFETPDIAGYSTIAALPIEAHLERMPAFADRLASAGVSHEGSLQTLLATWAREDADGAFEWALSNLPAVDESTIRSLGMTMAQRNASAAAGVVDRLPPDLRSLWISAIASSFGTQDPQAAIRLVLTLPRGSERDRSLGALVNAVLSNAYALDVELIEAFSSPESRDQAIRASLPSIRSGNAGEAAKLKEYVSAPDLKSQFERILARAQNQRPD